MKPLEHKDTNERAKVSWNLFINKRKNKNYSEMKDLSNLVENKEQNFYVLTKSVQEFYEKWRQIDDIEDKIKFLSNLR